MDFMNHIININVLLFILSVIQDISNFEWEFWTGWFGEIWPYIIGHIILGQLVRRVGFQVSYFDCLLYGSQLLV